MLRTRLESLFQAAIEGFVADRKTLPAIEIVEPRDPEHGDFACSFALAASKALGRPPREIALELIAELPENELIESTEIAGPGFINIRLNAEAVAECVAEILGTGAKGLAAGRSPNLRRSRINLEFVSVNPNGPITVGSGRGAAFGSTLANVLEAAGHSVHREYYINDGVNSEQMLQFALSVQSFVEGLPFPENGYKGDYVQEAANALKGSGESLGTPLAYQKALERLMLQRQRIDLGLFGVEFHTWFSEQSLHDSGVVAKCVEELVAKGAADDRPIRTKVTFAKGGTIEDVEIEFQTGIESDAGEANTDSVAPDSSRDQPRLNTLWLRSAKFGDDMDRVMRRRDGRLTYIASDVAYHKDKFNRGSKPDASGKVEPADKLITVLGPDHHGYIGRLHAVVGALLEANEPPPNLRKDHEEGVGSGVEPLTETESKLYRSPEERDACLAGLAESKRKLEVVIFQIVRFVKDGQPAPMRKRDGNIYSLRDLMAEIGKTAAPNEPEEEQMRIGKDVARFFYLMRSHDTHMDFDIDLATKQSDENPVFYCQYAHARICSVIRKGGEAGFSGRAVDAAALLRDPRELALIKRILELPYEVSRCALDYGVHRLTTFAVELARTYHHFYDGCRVIQPEEPQLTAARLALCEAARIGLRAVFNLLGVSAPERMDRVSLE